MNAMCECCALAPAEYKVQFTSGLGQFYIYVVCAECLPRPNVGDEVVVTLLVEPVDLAHAN